LIVTQYAFEPWQHTHRLKRFHAPFFMGIIKRPMSVGYAVQPISVTALVDTGFVGMVKSRSCLLLSGMLFKCIQGVKRLPVKIEKRALTDRNMQLIGTITSGSSTFCRVLPIWPFCLPFFCRFLAGVETPVRKFTKNIGKSFYNLASKANLYFSGLIINTAWIEQMKGGCGGGLIFFQPVLSSFDN
jgi:hypothetical protein